MEQHSSGYIDPYVTDVIEPEEQSARVPDQNGVSQAWYIAAIHQSGRKPSKCKNKS